MRRRSPRLNAHVQGWHAAHYPEVFFARPGPRRPARLFRRPACRPRLHRLPGRRPAAGLCALHACRPREPSHLLARHPAPDGRPYRRRPRGPASGPWPGASGCRTRTWPASLLADEILLDTWEANHDAHAFFRADGFAPAPDAVPRDALTLRHARAPRISTGNGRGNDMLKGFGGLGGLGDMAKMMKAAQEMQAKHGRDCRKTGPHRRDGRIRRGSGEGPATAKGELTGLDIDPSIFVAVRKGSGRGPDPCRDQGRAGQARRPRAAEEMPKLTEELGLPARHEAAVLTDGRRPARDRTR